MTFLLQALLFLVAAIVTVPLCKRLGLSLVLGYLAAGLIIGPSGLGLIGEIEEASEVRHFAEIGVVFLLFVIGLELQPRRLWVMRRLVFGLGTGQLGLTSVVLSGILVFVFDLGWPEAALFGFALALSSTAFVLQLLSERGTLNHAHGRAAFGTLLLQDVAVIPAIAVLDLVSPDTGSSTSIADRALLVGLVIGGLFGARLMLRPALKIIARTGVHELFTAAALALVVGAAVSMEAVGLSMGLGAFLAGMMVADSEYRHQLESDVTPFKGLLLGLFFMAVGMAVDVTLLISAPGLILGLSVSLLLVKSLILYPLSRAAGLDHAEAVRTSTVLSQGGEFAFVLLGAGLLAGLTDSDNVSIAVLVVTLSMVLTPLFGAAAERLLKSDREKLNFDVVEASANPVVIVGFGRVGQIVGRILTMRHIPFTALESSSHQVEFVRRFGNRVFYGDPINLQLLRTAHIDQARAIVVAVDDELSAERITSEVRDSYPDIRIFARAQNRQHELRLRDIGADFVIRETLGSSLQLGTEVLSELGMTRSDAEHAVSVFQAHDSQTLEKQQAIYRDEEAFRLAAMDAARELEELFKDDAGASGD